jgi:hypothetical protein
MVFLGDMSFSMSRLPKPWWWEIKALVDTWPGGTLIDLVDWKVLFIKD